MADSPSGSAARGLRVVVIGGSLGGLLAGNMLHRAGCDVTVHERIGTELAERGVGIATHPELHAAFERLGLPIDEAFGVRIANRVALSTDGRILARHYLPQIQATWGYLYRSLLGIFPDERYHAGNTLTRVERHGEGVRAHFAERDPIDADLLVGADGVRSTVRAQLWPDAAPQYAGYVAWRAVVEEDRLSAATREVLFTRFVICLPPGEHVVGYPVAGADGDIRPGRRRFNIVWYRAASPERLEEMQTDESGHYHEAGIPPALILPSLIDETRRAAKDGLPPALAEVVMRARGLFFQTIVDVEVPQMVQGPVVMLGDAAFAARPHASMGVIKATGDAVQLADAIAAHPGDVARALALYDAERTRYGRMLSRHSRRLGTQIDTPQRSAVDRSLGDYVRLPETIIRVTSLPPSCTPMARSDEEP
ncbi:MAG: hypothetical protein OXI57_05430 [Rhodospirillales bacterium]|nr:hypothetical protein [Rhodospirillales bacterium]